MKKTIAVWIICLFGFATFGQTKTSLQSQDINAEALKLVKKGQKAMEKGNHGKAKTLFEDAIKASDKCYQAYGYLAVVADLDNNTAQSIELFGKSLSVFDDYKAYVIERKMDYLKTMELEFMSEQHGLDRRTTNYADGQGNPALMQSNVNAKKDRVKELEEELEEAKNMKYPAFFCFKYGNSLMKANQADLARSAYESAIDSDPEFKDTYANLAVVYFMYQDCEKAMSTYKKGKELKAEFHPAFEKDLLSKCQQ